MKIMNEGIIIICKSIDNRFLKLNSIIVLFFQKLTTQENIILNV